MVPHNVRRRAGDNALCAFLRGRPADHRHGHADTADFTAYVEKRFPDQDFTEFRKDWLYGDGEPAPP